MNGTAKQSACPRCGEPASGRFCQSCGASLSASACASCGADLAAGAKFCNVCGTAVGAAAAPATTVTGRGSPPAWVVAAAILIVLVAFIAGQQMGARSAMPATASAAAGDAPFAPFAGGATRAPDISNMTPEEAASRLFDRVMRYASEGKPDSAAMFAPMAILAYERIGPPDAHARYDMGTISLVTGDAATAAAQADTVLKANATHLLGLLLAAKAADALNKPAEAARFRSKFKAAAAAERAKKLPEYTDHQRDIDDALKSPAA